MSERAYHHGDLKRALVSEGVELMRAHGPTGLAAREASRAVGVSVTALYRHFDSVEQWRADVSRCAREELARTMAATMDDVKPSRSPAIRARRRFRASGVGYVQFAIDEPNLFAGAFMHSSAASTEVEDPSAGAILEATLDDLMKAGVLAPELREAAPLIAWTSVHGLAALIAQGALPVTETRDPWVQAVLDGVDRALGIGSRQGSK